MLRYTSGFEALTLEIDYNSGVNLLKALIMLVAFDLSSLMKRFGSLFILLDCIIYKCIIKLHSWLSYTYMSSICKLTLRNGFFLTYQIHFVSLYMNQLSMRMRKYKEKITFKGSVSYRDLNFRDFNWRLSAAIVWGIRGDAGYCNMKLVAEPRSSSYDSQDTKSGMGRVA